MAYDGWLQFNGRELVNLSRTAQLADALGIDTVWVTPSSVQWIENTLGGSDYDVITEAPWYDPEYLASAEFAGLVPLSMAGLDDSTLQSTPIEYVTDGGSPGKSRNSTLPIVASMAIVASSDRGAEYGLRWLNRVLRDSSGPMFCSGADLRYFRSANANAEVVHRRDVRTTRGVSVTRKRSTSCSATWIVTFTLTDHDSYEYGDPQPAVFDLAGPMPTAVKNLVPNGRPTSTDDWHITNTGSGGLGIPGYDAGLGAFYGEVVVQPSDTAWTQRYGNQNSTATDRIPVRGATEYTVSFEAMSTVDDNRGIAIDWYGASGTVIGSSTLLSGARQALPAHQWKSFEIVAVSPAGAITASPAVMFSGLSGPAAIPRPVGSRLHQRRLLMAEGIVPRSAILPAGELVLTQQPCPEFDYTPIYDPLYPALVPSPTAPNFYPAGWNIEPGMTFSRRWVRVPPVEPSSLLVVPTITLTTDVEARRVRVSIWPSSSNSNDQCDPLFSVVVAYLPPALQFIIDGEQKASYVWDGSSPEVRRSDSLVYGPDAEPVNWTAFNDDTNLLITVDLFEDPASTTGEWEGHDTVRVEVEFTPKSD